LADPLRKVSTTDCHHCFGRALSPFCGALSAEEMNTFMQIKRAHRYAAGQAISYEGNPSQGIYILCSGSVKLTQSGQQQIIGIVSPGDLVEKGALFHPGAHSATAEAMAQIEVSFGRIDLIGVSGAPFHLVFAHHLLFQPLFPRSAACALPRKVSSAVSAERQQRQNQTSRPAPSETGRGSCSRRLGDDDMESIGRSLSIEE
jgi:signal-transduction protein with cAMP-binding, CBS, and nucleotidyltransferase domain